MGPQRGGLGWQRPERWQASGGEPAVSLTAEGAAVSRQHEVQAERQPTTLPPVLEQLVGAEVAMGA